MPPSILKRINHTPDVLDSNALTHKGTGKPLRIPKRVKEAILNILSGKAKHATIAAEQVGLSREHLSRMISRPHVQVFITDERRKTIAHASLRAASRLGELIDAESEHVSLDASKHVLAIEGITAKGTGVSVDVTVKAGYVIRLGSSNAPGAGQDRPAEVAGQVEARVTVARETNEQGER